MASHVQTEMENLANWVASTALKVEAVNLQDASEQNRFLSKSHTKKLCTAESGKSKNTSHIFKTSGKEIVGLDIATRADCMDFDRIKLLKEYDKKTETWIELGMQSIHEKTLDFINRGYSHEYFDKKARELIDDGFKIIVHIILGLPTETREDMLETFEYVKELHPFGVKIHSLYVDKHSRLGKLYMEKPFPVLTEEEYVNLVCDGMEILPRDIVYHRITGDPVRENLIVPNWTKHKCAVISSIQKELKRRNIDFV